MSRQQVFTARVKAAMDAISMVCLYIWGLEITAWSGYIVFNNGVVVTAVVDNGGTTTFTWIGHQAEGVGYVTKSVTRNDPLHADTFEWAKGVYEPNRMTFPQEVAFLPRKCWEGLAPLLPVIFGYREGDPNASIQMTYEAKPPRLGLDRLWDESKRYLRYVYRLTYFFRNGGHVCVYMDAETYGICFVTLYQAPFTIDFRFAGGELVEIPLLRGTAQFMR